MWSYVGLDCVIEVGAIRDDLSRYLGSVKKQNKKSPNTRLCVTFHKCVYCISNGRPLYAVICYAFFCFFKCFQFCRYAFLMNIFNFKQKKKNTILSIFCLWTSSWIIAKISIRSLYCDVFFWVARGSSIDPENSHCRWSLKRLRLSQTFSLVDLLNIVMHCFYCARQLLWQNYDKW